MARKKPEEERPRGSPAYMLTYGDMMTLLLTFFVLLMSFSSIRDAKFQRAMGSLKGAFGILPHDQFVIRPERVPIPRLTNLQESEIEESIVRLEDMLSDQQLREAVRLQISDRGMTITIEDPVMFESGSAELKPKAYPILTRVVSLARGWPNTIRIEGHTDSDPIHTERFPSNWELSTERALSVLHFFQDDAGFDPRDLVAIGRGEFDPIASNDTPENKAKNRRIEIHIEYNPEVEPPTGILGQLR